MNDYEFDRIILLLKTEIKRLEDKPEEANMKWGCTLDRIVALKCALNHLEQYARWPDEKI